jgi:pentatricopeptide repeat domain-containing protein 1
MDDMEERGIEPNLIVFNMAMKIYLQWNRHDLADALLEQMQQKGFKPDVRTHNVMLAHWSKVGTREAAQRAEELLETIHPDPYSFNLVLSAWGRVSEYEKMWDLYERVKNAQSFKPDLVTISTLLTFSAKSEDPFFVQRADNLLHQNVLTGLKCDFRHYFTVIRGWLGAGKVDRAMEILKQSASSPNPTIKPKPASYDIIVREFVGNGKIKEAVDFLEEFQHVKKGGPDWYTWNYLLEVWKGATHPQKDTYVRKLESIVARGIQRS